MLMTIFALLLITVIGLSVSFNGILEVHSSINYQHAVTAFYLADAGMNHAFREIEQHHLNFNTLLKGADGVENTADDGYLLHSSIPEAERIPAAGVSFGAGTYKVKVTDDNDGDGNPLVDINQRVILTSQGFGPNESTNTIQAIVSLGGGIPAIVTDGDLHISGNPVIQGNYGGVHANHDLTVSGNPTITTDATCSNVYTEAGHPTIGGQKGGGRPELEIPQIHAINHKPKADYILGADGKVRDQSGAILADCTDGHTSFRGWRPNTSNPIEWTSSTNQNDYFPGTYYIEGEVQIAGQIGSRDVTIPISIIAEGNIRVSGSHHIRPKSGDIFLLSDYDILITGDLEQDQALYAGFIAAHEQVRITGNSTLVGHIIAEDAANISSIVTSSDIAGNITITATGGFTSIGPTGIPMIISWREVRN